ncbi:uncharacterized protein LOC127796994 [Diospyros lotus]|uniref:uncharacterized protein LOC127796994 n=1 Tax=Diospyros lotus TaxID=55363 RepID=UPI00224EF30B|nr:uncharacterized protein LOC127796994 [Diospyros lotus]
MSAFSRLTFCVIIYGLVFALCFCTSVRSEHDESSAIRLPSEGDNAGGGDDLCSGTVTHAACPVKCFRTDPVCGVDGVTYWCGCADALCAGTRVAKRGFCDVSGGGSALLSGQAFLLVHIVWLLLLGFSVLFGLL